MFSLKTAAPASRLAKVWARSNESNGSFTCALSSLQQTPLDLEPGRCRFTGTDQPALFIGCNLVELVAIDLHIMGGRCRACLTVSLFQQGGDEKGSHGKRHAEENEPERQVRSPFQDFVGPEAAGSNVSEAMRACSSGLSGIGGTASGLRR